MSAAISFHTPLYVLAPLAGFTDVPFRFVVKKFGADLTVSEMISANALVHGNAKTLKMLEKADNEIPYSIQIAGSDVKVVKKAVEILNDIDNIDCIDFNIGCPTPKVVGHGSGSALLKDLNHMQDLLFTLKQSSKKAYTSAKMRIGFDNDNALEIASKIEATGIDFLAIHGRTRIGKFKVPVNYDAIKRVKDALTIPIIANGNIDTFDKAQWVLNYTKADGVMIGRGAIGNPWIFHQLKHGKSDITLKVKQKIILQHYDKMVETYGSHGSIKFRSQLHAYSKGFKKANNFRNIINKVNDPNKMRILVADFFSNEFQIDK